MPDTRPHVLLSAGGTGGHLFPAEALAAELLRRGYKVSIMTDRRGHAFRSLGEDVSIYTVRAATLRPGAVSKIRAMAEMALGVLQALALVRRLGPALVIGFGGYPSFPGVAAAQILRIPTMLHEQNAVLGKANIWLARGARDIAVALPDTRNIPAGSAAKVSVTGNPVRRDIVAAGEIPYQPSDAKFCVLVTGGSQAAAVFGDVVPAAAAKLPDDLRSRLVMIHQCRVADVDRVATAYHAAGITAETRPFFNDMAERLGACHLFIGRSGASTVAEIAVAGRPAIFVPYPGHADMQQKHNAGLLTAKGGGWLMLQEDFTPDALADKLAGLLGNPAALAAAAAAAKSCGKPDADRQLADLVDSRIKKAD